MFQKAKLIKLGTGGNFHSWKIQLKNFLQSIGAWDLVSQDNGALHLMEGEDEVRVTAKVKQAICSSLHMDILEVIEFIETPRAMYQKIEELFRGTADAQKASARKILYGLEYNNTNCFQFMTQFDRNIRTLEALDGIFSWKETALLFLDKFPQEFAFLTHSLKREVREANENRNLYQNAYNRLVEFLMERGLYDATKRQERAFKSSEQRPGRSVKNGRRRKKKQFKNRKNSDNHQNNTPKEESTPRALLSCSNLYKTLSLVDQKPGEFLLDSGASKHICGDLTMFSHLEKISSPMEFTTANGPVIAESKGIINATLDNGVKVILNDVIYWKNAPLLLSVSTLDDNDIEICFKKGRAKIIDSRNSKLLYTAAKNEHQVYCVKMSIQKQQAHLSRRVWHLRLNHCSDKKLKHTLKDIVEVPQKLDQSLCKGCLAGKLHRKPVNKTRKATNYFPLETLVADTIGPYDTSVDRKRGALVVTDCATNFCFVFPIRLKTEVVTEFIGLLERLEIQFENRVKAVRTDNGTEFCNERLSNYLDSKGITHERTEVKVHETNGRAENQNRILLEATRTLLQTANFSRGFWSFAMKTACFVHNMSASTTGQESPWLLLYGVKPPLERLMTFGVPGFAHIPTEGRRKLDPTSTPVYFLGYENFGRSYIVMSQGTRRIFRTRTFVADEEAFARKVFSNGGEDSVENSYEDDFDVCLEDVNTKIWPSDISESVKEGNAANIDISPETERENIVQNEELNFNLNDENFRNEPNQLNTAPEESTTTTDFIQPESADNEELITEIDDELVENDVTFLDTNQSESNIRSRLRSSVQVPERYREQFNSLRPGEQVQKCASLLVRNIKSNALKLQLCLKAKGFHSYKKAVDTNDRWKEEYRKELKKLETIGDLEVVLRDETMKDIIPFIEVLTEKKDPISGELKLKVKLAARGDLEKRVYEDVYSPAAKAEILRLFIATMKKKGCLVLQGDVPSTFLRGRIDEDVFLFLPQGHPKETKDNKFVYKCPASLYGLAISGKVWYYTFKAKLLKNKWIVSKKEPTLFRKTKNQLRIYTDSSFADAQEDKFKSTGGYLIFLGKSLVTWQAKKIKWVCSSASQAEYYALYAGLMKGLEFAYLLQEFFNEDVFPLEVFIDNTSCIDVIKQQRGGDFNRHFATKFYSILQWFEEQLFTVEYISSKNNLADHLTKQTSHFNNFLNTIFEERGSIEAKNASYSTVSTGTVKTVTAVTK